MSDYGTPHPPGVLARSAVSLTVRLLPKGATRDRYRHEFLAELYGLSTAAQLRHAAAILGTSVALRSAVDPQQQPTTAELIMPTPRRRKPLLCRLNVRHKWHGESTEDGGRCVQCRRCGKDKTELVGPRGGDFPSDFGGLRGMIG